MPEPEPVASPQVHDRRSKPSGVVPRNAQNWLLIGIAVLMVAVITLSGRSPRKGPTVPASPATMVVDPSAARIEDYQRRVEEETRKLQLEQAQLARAQQKLALGPQPPVAGPGASAYPSTAQMSYGVAGTPLGEDPMASDKRRREYQSLFASNVALSYRKDVQSPVSPSAGVAVAGSPPAGERPTSVGVQTKPAQKEDDDLQRAEGKRYRVFEGTVLETVLTNRLDGSYSGPVNCMVTTHVYSHDGQRLLIPQGSRVLGEVHKVDSLGQQRLAVSFHRLIMPDGFSVSLDKFEGLNQIGETGLRDQVNHHYMQLFGVSIAIGAIAGLSEANTRTGLDVSAADAYRQGVAGSLAQSSLQILDRYLNVLPTFTIREGHRVKVYLSEDLLLPAYEKHQLPSDL
jgi:type IV secretory pathway VirB10-like protein